MPLVFKIPPSSLTASTLCFASVIKVSLYGMRGNFIPLSPAERKPVMLQILPAYSLRPRAQPSGSSLSSALDRPGLCAFARVILVYRSTPPPFPQDLDISRVLLYCRQNPACRGPAQFKEPPSRLPPCFLPRRPPSFPPSSIWA